MENIRHDKDTLRGITLGLVASVIWGAWPVISKLSTQSGLSAFDITALRFTVSGLLLLPLLVINYRQLKRLLGKGIALSIGAGVPYILLGMEGLNHAPAHHFGIIVPSTMLIISMLGSYFWLREHHNRKFFWGIALVLSGLVIMALPLVESLSAASIKGDLMFVGCGLLWASYTLLCKRWQLAPLISTALVSVLSMLYFMPFYLTTAHTNISNVSASEVILHGLFQGVITAFFALLCYSKAVFILGSGKGALFSALVPSTSAVLAFIVLSESIAGIELLALIAVSIAMLLALGAFQTLPQWFQWYIKLISPIFNQYNQSNWR